jgi:hypothetical protein
VAEVPALVYLHGLSTGDFAPALTEFFGSGGAVAVGRHPVDDPVTVNRPGFCRDWGY